MHSIPHSAQDSAQITARFNAAVIAGIHSQPDGFAPVLEGATVMDYDTSDPVAVRTGETAVASTGATSSIDSVPAAASKPRI